MQQQFTAPDIGNDNELFPVSPDALPIYNNIEQALSAYDGDDPINVLYPRKIASAAQAFLTGFPGRVLYAVKANPHPGLLRMLWAEGIRNFDVASLREVELLGGMFPDARLYLMHPVKSRTLIAEAYALGVRDFAFDSAQELTKILEETGNANDSNLHLRLAIHSSDAAMPLVGKFGATADEAVRLLRRAREKARTLGLCFHVGSQCLNPDAYANALGVARMVIDAAGVDIESIDVGGGFPVAYPGMTPPSLTHYFSAIDASISAHGFDGMEVLGEPGRAMVAKGGSTLARVELRKDDALYLNDGVYGSLFDAGQFAWRYPVKLYRSVSGVPQETQKAFRLFGPTCDSHDAMAGPFHLPADVSEGDWIEIRHLGAYGQALAGRFNGFCSDTTFAVLECD